MTNELPEKPPIEVVSSKQVKLLFSWKAPIRPFKKRDKEFWTTVLSIILLLSLILLFVKEWVLIAAMISLVFLFYVLSMVPPEEIEYRITSQGINFEDSRYDWEALRRFWFSSKYDSRILHLESWFGGPRKVNLVINKNEEEKLKEILEKYLLNEEPEPTFLDRAAGWLGEKIPLEITEKEKSLPVPTSSK